jgi:hypothetical protein
MKSLALAALALALLGGSFLSAPALAQQKTIKACQDEWRANKDAESSCF